VAVTIMTTESSAVAGRPRRIQRNLTLTVYTVAHESRHGQPVSTRCQHAVAHNFAKRWSIAMIFHLQTQQ